MKKRRINGSLIVFLLFVFLALLTLTSTFWCKKTFGNVGLEEIIYTLTAPTTGTDKSVIVSWIMICLLGSLGLDVLLCLIYCLTKKLMLIRHVRNKLVFKINRYLWVGGVLFLIVSLVQVNANFDVIGYVMNKNSKTDIYEKKLTKKKKTSNAVVEVKDDDSIIYVNPADVQVSGANPNNLIYIYLESYENLFMDNASGGTKTTNHLPELTALAKENISFSNTDKMGGALKFTGTTWTIASMVAQSSGLPLKTEVANDMGKYSSFMPGAMTIGDILEKNGYLQELFIGSDVSFAGTDKLFSTHGNYKLVDYNTLVEENRVLKQDKCEWGINDSALLREAKVELTNLANSGSKFNFTMATIDCHTPRGINCPNCPSIYDYQYENVYACQSRQVSDFIYWCKEQPWYNNTTIVLVGDHQSMVPGSTTAVPDGYVRTTYNCIINSRVTTANIKNRQFTHLDMFPTTLAAMGFEIKGNKLSLGTNLFAKIPTTIEKYGLDYIEQEVQKSSTYLEENIYNLNK